MQNGKVKTNQQASLKDILKNSIWLSGVVSALSITTMLSTFGLDTKPWFEFGVSIAMLWDAVTFQLASFLEEIMPFDPELTKTERHMLIIYSVFVIPAYFSIISTFLKRFEENRSKLTVVFLFRKWRFVILFSLYATVLLGALYSDNNNAFGSLNYALLALVGLLACIILYLYNRAYLLSLIVPLGFIGVLIFGHNIEPIETRFEDFNKWVRELKANQGT